MMKQLYGVFLTTKEKVKQDNMALVSQSLSCLPAKAGQHLLFYSFFVIIFFDIPTFLAIKEI